MLAHSSKRLSTALEHVGWRRRQTTNGLLNCTSFVGVRNRDGRVVDCPLVSRTVEINVVVCKWGELGRLGNDLATSLLVLFGLKDIDLRGTTTDIVRRTWVVLAWTCARSSDS